MTQTFEATFQGGTFRALQSQDLKLPEGQRVTLTIETVSDKAAMTMRADQQSDYDGLWNLQRPGWMAPEVAEQLESPSIRKLNKALDGVNETLQNMTAPPILLEEISRRFKKIVAEVRSIQAEKPKNKMQEFARTVVAIFNNVSSLLVYVILIAGVLKVMFLVAANNAKIAGIAQAIDNAWYITMPLVLFVILLCLLGVEALHKISGFVRSYRVMSIFGCAIAIKFIIKTAIVLFTSASFSSIGAAAWQLFSGALK